MIDAFLSGTRPGLARLLHAPRVPDALVAVEAWAEVHEPSVRVVTLTVDPLPDVRRLLVGAVDAVAEVGLRLWPRWYETSALAVEASRDDVLRRASPSASRPWLRRAAARAEAGRRPLPRGFTRRTHLRQLALACRAPDLLLVVATEDETATPPRLAGLARGAEWLAREAEARVVVVAPGALVGARELEPIAYGSLHWEPATPAGGGSVEEQGTVRVWPIVGQPHPFSPGEQRLAAALAEDAELAPLFAFNQRVRTRRGSDYVVDLVWADGRVAVEVDGYAHHSNRYAFVRDRHRDYDLLVSGFAVLRLPHDEVIEDVQLALDKIRDVVALRRTTA